MTLHIYKWFPPEGIETRAVVQIAHGMAEWGGRYEAFAKRLTEAGYAVYTNDHKGHGQTAASPMEIGHAGPDGFEEMVRDLHGINQHIKQTHPGLPVFLLGHSMGSFLAQRCMINWGEELKGIILSGSNGKQIFGPYLGLLIAKYQMGRYGATYRSELLDRLSFGRFNKAFRPARTRMDWLNRDPAEVDRYIADPFCGVVCSAGFFHDLFSALVKLHERRGMDRIPKHLPLYIFSGDRDPVGNFGRGPTWLAQRYRKLGLLDVTIRLYHQGRHEMIREINHDEVAKDVISWMDARLQ